MCNVCVRARTRACVHACVLVGGACTRVLMGGVLQLSAYPTLPKCTIARAFALRRTSKTQGVCPAASSTASCCMARCACDDAYGACMVHASCALLHASLLRKFGKLMLISASVNLVHFWYLPYSEGLQYVDAHVLTPCSGGCRLCTSCSSPSTFRWESTLVIFCAAAVLHMLHLDWHVTRLHACMLTLRHTVH